MRKALRLPFLWVVVTVTTTTAALLGAPPVWVSIVAACVWWLVLAPRHGHGVALIAISLGWVVTTFVAACLAYAMPWAVAPVVVIAHGLAALLGTFAMHRFPMVANDGTTSSAASPSLVGALCGGAVWLATWACGRYGWGGGLAWSIYSDSTRDLWFIRQNLREGGVPFADTDSSWPVEHALTTAQVAVGSRLATTPAAVAEELHAHALGWTLVIAMACTLVGYLATRVTWALTRHGGAAQAAGVVASMAVLWMPVTGFVLRVGQLNVHMVLSLVFLSALAALEPTIVPWARAAIQVAVAALLILVWVPFVILPATLAVREMWRAMRAGEFQRAAPLAVVGATVAASLFAVGSYALPSLQNVADSMGDSGGGVLAASSHIPNPNAPALAILIVVVTPLLGLRWWRTDKVAAGTTTAIVGASLLAVLSYAVMRHGLDLNHEYYAAKVTSMATIMAGLALIGPVFALTVMGRREKMALAGIVGLAAAAGIATPVRHAAEPWLLAPFAVATATTYGADDVTTDRVIAYSRPDEVVLAWRLNPPYDYHVNFMLSVMERDVTKGWETDLRRELRGYGDDSSIARLCAIADASDLPVTVITHDARLADEVEARCPDALLSVQLERG